MSFELQGKITNVLDLQTGVSKAGKEWQKLSVIVSTGDEYNNLYCFELFGVEKVEDFTARFKVGMDVKVDFNINTNEWNGKYFTSLGIWKIDGVGNAPAPQQETPPTGGKKDLPF